MAGLTAAFVAMYKDPANIFVYVAAAAMALFVLYRNLRVLQTNRKTAVMETLTAIEDEAVLLTATQSEKAVLYKHSTRCPISRKVYQEVIKFADKNPDIPVYLLRVIEQRTLSNQVADIFSVAHQSPQVFVIKNGQQVWHASHYDITAAKLQEYI